MSKKNPAWGGKRPRAGRPKTAIKISVDWEAFKSAADLERGGTSTEEEYLDYAQSLCSQAIDAFIKAHRDREQCDPAVIV